MKQRKRNFISTEVTHSEDDGQSLVTDNFIKLVNETGA